MIELTNTEKPGEAATDLQMRSAVDLWLIALLIGVVLAVAVLAARVLPYAPLQGAGALALALIAVSVVLMRGIPCYYLLDQEALRVRGGIQRWRVPYGHIVQIDHVWSAQGAAAWSAHRLRIRHRGGVLQISPLDRTRFEVELRARIVLDSVRAALGPSAGAGTAQV